MPIDDENLDMREMATLVGTATGQTARRVVLEGTSGAPLIQTISSEHYEIHEGDHFYIKNFSTVASGTNLDFGITVPAGSKYPHMNFDIAGTQQTILRIFEGATISGGTVVTPLNNNRSSDKVSILTAKMNPTVSASGTEIFSQSAGVTAATPARTGVVGLISRERELILDTNKSYVFRITSAGDGNIIDYTGEWYEYTM